MSLYRALCLILILLMTCGAVAENAESPAEPEEDVVSKEDAIKMLVLEAEVLADPAHQTIDKANIFEGSLPNADHIRLETWLYDGDGNPITDYQREDPIYFGDSSEYTQLEGITTFRGNNYRDQASYGTTGGEPEKFDLKWVVGIGGIDEWTGVGWTGQASIVKWPAETVQIMNIYDEKKAKGELTEVIYATLDGKIYFLDFDDGEPTRDPIKVGAPIKGSLSVDPRGYPLLYCGQGIDEVDGKSVKIGTRIFSLIDHEVLLFIDGHDKNAYRHWYAFDSSPLIHAETDTMLQLGENGIFYTIKLNTDYDPAAGTISIDPEMVKYVYKSKISSRPGMENSMAVYNNYAMFVDNSGLIQCVDINTMQPVWAGDVADDTDSTSVLEVEDDGGVMLYTANELDLRSDKGDCHIRKVNVMTGLQEWRVDVPVRQSGDDNGGAYATPAIGKGSLKDYIYYQIARTSDGGTMFCINKETGEIAWQRDLKAYGWSSPVCIYSDSGKGYVIVGSCSGQLRCLDGLTGELICDADLQANIEGSPIVYGNTIIVGTRGRKIAAITVN